MARKFARAPLWMVGKRGKSISHYILRSPIKASQYPV